MAIFTKKGPFPGILLLLLCAVLVVPGGCSRDTGSGQAAPDIDSISTEEDVSSTAEEAKEDKAVPASKSDGTSSGVKTTNTTSKKTRADKKSGFSAKGKGLLIVLDPGHSQQVPGTMEPIGPGSSEMKDADTVGTYGPSSGLHEYELTMQVCQKLRAELENRGYKVKFTHVDTYLPISCTERAAVANENKADAFLRIHANGSENTSANGAMTICITKDNPYHPELYEASARLSMLLLNTYCEKTGAKKEYVWETDSMTGNNWAEVPTSLIELGYMTNPDEDLRMAQDSYQKKMASAIADGLDKWFEEMPEKERKTHPALADLEWDSAPSAETGAAAKEADDAGRRSQEQDKDRKDEKDSEDGDQDEDRQDSDSGEDRDQDEEDSEDGDQDEDRQDEEDGEDGDQDEDRQDSDSGEDGDQDEDRQDSSSGEDAAGTGSGSEETDDDGEVLLDED